MSAKTSGPITNTVTESKLIETIQRHLGKSGERVHIGIGDDAASLRPPSLKRLLASSDSMVEGTHFDLAFATPRDLGHKALASALSDIAAMNGRPLYALVSLAIPMRQVEVFIDGFYHSAAALARACKIDIVGGDLTRSPQGIFIDVTCIGESDLPFSRMGARPGDWLAVSGHPGASAAGLYALQSRPRDQVDEELARAHLRPTPRFDLLPFLNARPGLCTSLIDVSDGLSTEIHHLAKNSGVGFIIETQRLPHHPKALRLARVEKQDPLIWSFSGGEDYELLATLSPEAVRDPSEAPPGFTIIGRAVPPDEGVHLIDEHDQRRALAETGFNHFASS